MPRTLRRVPHADDWARYQHPIVRYLTQDDPSQSAKAREVIEQRLTDENAGFVSIVAMVETVWVLEHDFD